MNSTVTTGITVISITAEDLQIGFGKRHGIAVSDGDSAAAAAGADIIPAAIGLDGADTGKIAGIDVYCSAGTVAGSTAGSTAALRPPLARMVPFTVMVLAMINTRPAAVSAIVAVISTAAAAKVNRIRRTAV